MREEVLVDVRDLPSPEPLERVVNALGTINASRYLKMVHRMEPMLLLPILEKNGFGYQMRKNADEVWVYIYRKDDRETEHHIKGL